jgi:glycosyltransferase involved in cell wall biosynthesis
VGHIASSGERTDAPFAERRQVLEVELAPCSAARSPSDGRLRTVTGDPVVGGAATVLVRLHGSPLARSTLDVPDGADRAGLVDLVLPMVAQEVAEHMRADGQAAPDRAAGAVLQLPEGVACADRLPLPSPAPRVTVVVPTVGREDLAGCLRALLAQDYDDFEVVVVDNASSDAGRQVLDRVLDATVDPAHRIRRVVEPRPGASFARNCGLAAASGSLVAFVDDDILVDGGWLRAVVAAFDVVPGVAGVTGLVLPWELETQEQAWFEQYGGFGKGFRRRAFDLDRHRGEHVLYPYLPGQYGTGASIAFRTDFIRALGGFDPALGGRRPVVGGEDIDVLLRTVLSGAALVYEPRALVWYQPYRETRALRRQMVIYGRGLSAVLLKAALAKPAVGRDIVRRLPAGLRLLLDPGSSKNAGKRDFPKALTIRELAGVASGPFAYAWARSGQSRPRTTSRPKSRR